MFYGRKRVIQSYEARLDELKEAGRASGLSHEEIELTLKQSILYLDQAHGRDDPLSFRRKRKSLLRYIIALTVVTTVGSCFFFNFYRPVHNFVERNIQEIIYPFMTSYRRMTLPIVKAFPLLTGLLF